MSSREGAWLAVAAGAAANHCRPPRTILAIVGSIDTDRLRSISALWWMLLQREACRGGWQCIFTFAAKFQNCCHETLIRAHSAPFDGCCSKRSLFARAAAAFRGHKQTQQVFELKLEGQQQVGVDERCLQWDLAEVRPASLLSWSRSNDAENYLFLKFSGLLLNSCATQLLISSYFN